MKSLKGLASIIVLVGLTVCTSHVKAETKLQQNQSTVESQINSNQPVPNNQNSNSNLESGFKLLQEGNYPKAIESFTQVITAEPNNQYAYVGRGATYLTLKDYQKAKKDLDKSISINSNNSYAYLFRGLSNYALGIKQEAISDLKIATNLLEKDGQKEMAQKSRELLKEIQKS